MIILQQSVRKKAGVVALVGRSNVGKSTLLNALVGTKISITSPRPQTTRFPIQGVFHDERGQIVFVDTPGLFAKPRDALTKRVNVRIGEALEDVQAILYVVDPTREIGREEKLLLARIQKIPVPRILVMNKIDIMDPPFRADYELLRPQFSAACEISALRKLHIRGLLDTLFSFLPEGEPLYPEFQLTNLDTRRWIAELIREKVFLVMRQEVPYTAAVEIENMETRDNGMLVIEGIIFTTDDHHQRMLIGRNAQRIKEIGSMARKELEAATGKKVYIRLEVRVDPHWMERLV
ncbi:MAG: GTPase Era [Parcubacteria group bacterium]|nr:GTPase Era [Parcubacteria group bacterium]